MKHLSLKIAAASAVSALAACGSASSPSALAGLSGTFRGTVSWSPRNQVYSGVAQYDGNQHATLSLQPVTGTSAGEATTYTCDAPLLSSPNEYKCIIDREPDETDVPCVSLNGSRSIQLVGYGLRAYSNIRGQRRCNLFSNPGVPFVGVLQ